MDWKNPDYPAIFKERAQRLTWLRRNPSQLPLIKEFYRNNIAQFISDFGMSFDPRNIERGLPSVIPFILFRNRSNVLSGYSPNGRGKNLGLSRRAETWEYHGLLRPSLYHFACLSQGWLLALVRAKKTMLIRLAHRKAYFGRLGFLWSTYQKSFAGLGTCGETTHT